MSLPVLPGELPRREGRGGRVGKVRRSPRRRRRKRRCAPRGIDVVVGDEGISATGPGPIVAGSSRRRLLPAAADPRTRTAGAASNGLIHEIHAVGGATPSEPDGTSTTTAATSARLAKARATSAADATDADAPAKSMTAADAHVAAGTRSPPTAGSVEIALTSAEPLQLGPRGRSGLGRKHGLLRANLERLAVETPSLEYASVIGNRYHLEQLLVEAFAAAR
mmetsp:Transcript_9658/g.20479  ORF Transcript_9658/g.20479 Transcript_9658/m.20479 type:complete len:222 (-) Transcript_9658:635-1300(-)